MSICALQYVNYVTKTRLMFQKIVKSITTLLHFQIFVDRQNVLVYNHIKLKRVDYPLMRSDI